MMKSMLAVLLLGGLSAWSQEPESVSKPVGAWTWQVVPPRRPAGPIYGVTTIHADGTLKSADTTQITPQQAGPSTSDPTFFTTASLGAWKKTSTGFSATHVELLANPDSSLFATCTTQWTVELGADGSTFSGTASFQCLAADGRMDQAARFPITGKRIEVAEQ